MMKAIVSLLILLTLFSINTFAANFPPRQKAILEPRQSIYRITFSPDGSTLASGGWDRNVRLWDVVSGQLKAVLTGHSHNAVGVAFSPDGSTLASGSLDKTVRLWDVASRQQKFVLTGHTDRAESVAFSPDGSILASTGWGDQTVRLWDAASGKPKAILIGHTDDVFSIAFSPDGSTLASAGTSTVHLWDMASMQSKATLILGGQSWTRSVAFSPDGSTLASAGTSTVHLWDMASDQLKSIRTGHLVGIESIAFSPDGSTLASAGMWHDETVRLWDVASGQLKAVLTGHQGPVVNVTFSPDGSTLASGGLGPIILWDLTTTVTTTPAIVRISPTSVQPSTIGEHLTVSVNIVGGENVVGYQATVVFNPDALIYFSSANEDYLSDDAFFVAPIIEKNYVTLASAGAEGRNGDGTLATITFQVVDVRTSGFLLSEVTLVNPEEERLFPYVENSVMVDGIAEDSTLLIKDSTGIEAVYLAEDVNKDSVVNILDLVLVGSNFGQIGENAADVNGDGIVDIVDLVKVAGVLGNAAAAPSVYPQTLAMLTAADVHGWLIQAQHLNLTDIVSQKGMHFLEKLLAVLTPKKTTLLPNYPNPFNPETWIPYQLANPSNVQIIIYDMRGIAIRHLALGHQPAGYYTTQSRAAYWDGHNDLGEGVAAGVYVYQLQADSMSLSRKMVILK